MKKNLLIATTVFVALMSTYFLWSHIVTNQMVGVADQLKVPSSWKLASEDIQVESLFCLNGGSCPEISRQWNLDTPITPEQFHHILHESGWDLEIEGDCLLPENVYGTFISICDASSVIDGYRVTVGFSENSSTHQQQAGVNLRPL